MMVLLGGSALMCGAQEPTQPHTLTTPHHRPTVIYTVSSICAWQAQVMGDFIEISGAQLTPPELTALYAQLSVAQAIVVALIADARVSDPRFQCYGWDFSEEDK